MSEDCQRCGTAMYDLDEDRNCPGCSYRDIEDYDLLLTGLGTFDPNDCISAKDLGKILDKPTDWKDWITSQIEQEGIEKYTSWYARMFERGAICGGLCEAHNEIFGEKE